MSERLTVTKPEEPNLQYVQAKLQTLGDRQMGSTLKHSPMRQEDTGP
jgi:hypothetical protein